MALFKSNSDEVGDEWEDLLEWIDDALWRSGLTEWEEGFLSDIRDRLVEFEHKTFLSARQREVLDRIRDK